MSKSKGGTFVSLFSGCGGFDLGFCQEGFECLAAIDIDKAALKVHENNIPGPIVQEDLSDGELRIELPPKVDVVLSGSPCQGFSTLGKRRIDDPRNSLLVSGGMIALKLKPKVFIAENVLAVRAGQHHQYWERMACMFRESGYMTTEIVLDAREVGLAQRRRRVFFIAWNTGANVKFTTPVFERASLRDAIANVNLLKNHKPAYLRPNSDEYLIATRIKSGQKLSNVRNGSSAIHTWDIPEVFGVLASQEREALTEIIGLRRRIRVRDVGDADPLPISLLNETFGEKIINKLIKLRYLRRVDMDGPCADLCHAFNGKYRRLSWDLHSNTVDTRFCSPIYYLHPEEQRGFSTREAARLQGFPDDFLFSDAPHDHVLVGNAVPPPVGRLFAKYIRQGLLK